MRRLLLLALLLTAGCELGEIEHVGTVVHVDQDGGFWGIVSSEDGTRFRPTNLPELFWHEGTVIEFEGYVVSEGRKEGDWGIPVELNEVEVSLDGKDD